MNEVSYEAGDEVLLDADAAHIAALVNAAQRGVVVSRHADPEETRYTVRFPGRLGAIEVPSGALLPAPPFEQIRLGPRHVARTLDTAVAVLVEVSARIQSCTIRREVPSKLDVLDRRTLAAAIEQRCRMLPGQVLGQLAPEIEAKTAELLTAHAMPFHPARVAGRDRRVPGVPPAVPPEATRRRSSGRVAAALSHRHTAGMP